MPFNYDHAVKHEEIVSKFDEARRNNVRAQIRCSMLVNHINKCKEISEALYQNEIKHFSRQYSFLEQVPQTVKSYLSEDEIKELSPLNSSMPDPLKTSLYDRAAAARGFTPSPIMSRRPSLLSDQKLVKFSCHKVHDSNVKFLGTVANIKADKYLRDQIIQRRIRNCRSAMERASADGLKLCDEIVNYDPFEVPKTAPASKHGLPLLHSGAKTLNSLRESLKTTPVLDRSELPKRGRATGKKRRSISIPCANHIPGSKQRRQSAVLSK